MKIRNKLILSFLLILSLIGGVALYNYWTLNAKISEAFDIIIEHDIRSDQISGDLEKEFRVVEEYANGYISSDLAKEKIEEIEERVKSNYAIIISSSLKQEDLEKLKNIIEKGEIIRDKVFESRSILLTTMNEFDEFVELTNDLSDNSIKQVTNKNVKLLLSSLTINIAKKVRAIEEYANNWETLDNVLIEISEIDEIINKDLKSIAAAGLDTKKYESAIEKGKEIEKSLFLIKDDFFSYISEFDGSIKELDVFLDSIHETTERDLAAAKTEIFKILKLNLWIIVGVILIAIGISLYISNSISIPLIQLKDAAVRISQGEMNTKIEIKYRDEVGEMADAFDNMRTSLKVMMEKYDKVSDLKQ